MVLLNLRSSFCEPSLLVLCVLVAIHRHGTLLAEDMLAPEDRGLLNFDMHMGKWRSVSFRREIAKVCRKSRSNRRNETQSNRLRKLITGKHIVIDLFYVYTHIGQQYIFEYVQPYIQYSFTEK